MIAANELRIGNYVNHKSEGISRVTEIESHKNHIGVTPLSFNNYVFMCAEIKPIPLTPEILEKCGFVSNPYQDRYELGDFHFEYCAIRNIVWCEKYPHIKYLHQLQNLYFALTGEELIINL